MLMMGKSLDPVEHLSTDFDCVPCWIDKHTPKALVLSFRTNTPAVTRFAAREFACKHWRLIRENLGLPNTVNRCLLEVEPSSYNKGSAYTPPPSGRRVRVEWRQNDA